MMKTIDRMARPQRRDRQLHERVHDPYRLRQKPVEPVYCPSCGVVFHKGRWQWADARPDDARPDLCPACRRTRDAAPAGVVTIEGWFVAPHKDEIIGLVHRVEADEKSTHPLNRIMTLREDGAHLEVTTTDIHLPRRIGEALASAWHGHLTYHHAPEEYSLQVTWRRDD